MDKLSDREEEVLEFLWIETQEHKKKPGLDVLRDEPELSSLTEKGFLDLKNEALLTEKGLAEAALCVRRHRLAERLLADIFDVKDPLMHEASCKFEHGLHAGLQDNICTLLGHPRTCPHGKTIPPGACCKQFETVPKRFIVPLRELSPGEGGRISYISTHDAEVVRKLIAMGILPGVGIELLHRFPSFVFRMGGSTFAIDHDLAEHIFVLVLKRK
ncbi:MAG: metal-dependent transcriptional regulator [Candidatus Omnitrophota bacterium]